jgi:hypothetical protein
MSVSSSDRETTSVNAPAQTPFLRRPPFVFAALLALSALSAFSLSLAPAVLMAASHIAANSAGGPVWP